jgi:hypothetical protein
MLLASPSPHAQVYKWVDENGKAHYSDKPSEAQKQKAQTVPTPAAKAPAQAANPPEDWQNRERDFQRRRVEQGMKEVEQAQAIKERCAQSRKALAQLRDDVALYRVNDKGERVYIEAPERKAMEQKARQDMTQHCGN